MVMARKDDAAAVGELVVAGGQGPPLLEDIEGALNDVAPLVGLGVVCDGACRLWSLRAGELCHVQADLGDDRPGCGDPDVGDLIKLFDGVTGERAGCSSIRSWNSAMSASIASTRPIILAGRSVVIGEVPGQDLLELGGCRLAHRPAARSANTAGSR